MTKPYIRAGVSVRNYTVGAQSFKVDDDAVSMLLAIFGYPTLASPVTKPTQVFTPHAEEDNDNDNEEATGT